jgi:hypothetical protein
LTYTPSAYAQRWDAKYHIFITTPSGAVVRLWTTYNNIKTAEEAIASLGFHLIQPPTKTNPLLTLNRGNTTPR